ncbi:MAG: CehA/McbA family metallohydrolase [Myxococcota bacterium]
MTARPVGGLRLDGAAVAVDFEVSLGNAGPGSRATLDSAFTPPGVALQGLPLDLGVVRRGTREASAPGFTAVLDAWGFLRAGEIELSLESRVARDAAGFEVDRAGEWLAGDLHVHATGASNDTDDESYPADIERVARERGLDFVVLTDHSNSTGSDPSTTEEDPALFNMGPEFPYWERATELSEPGRFWMVDGNEISPRHPGLEPTGHVGCIPPSLTDFDLDGAFVDRPMGSVSGAETLAQARDRGCFVVLNHPFAVLPWTSFDWTGFDYDAIEVWNGGLALGFTELEVQNHEAWRCDLLQGRRVTPLGNTDIHRVGRAAPGRIGDPALGYPATSVLATERTWESIVAGLQAGRVSIHGGASRLFLDAYDGDRRQAEDRSARELRVRGHLDVEAETPAVVRVTRATDCVDERASRRTPVQLVEEALLAQEVQPGETFEFVIGIGGEPGVYSARMHPDFAAGLLPLHTALSRAIVVE